VSEGKAHIVTRAVIVSTQMSAMSGASTKESPIPLGRNSMVFSSRF